MTFMDKLKTIVGSLMTDNNDMHELSSYSFILTTIGLHVLLGYHEYIGIHTTITEYATAMGLNASGHGIAYLSRR